MCPHVSLCPRVQRFPFQMDSWRLREESEPVRDTKALLFPEPHLTHVTTDEALTVHASSWPLSHPGLEQYLG